MRKTLISILAIAAILCVSMTTSCLSENPAKTNPSYSEETIIEMVLSHLWSGSKYTIVEPETTFRPLNDSDDDEEFLADLKEYLFSELVELGEYDQDIEKWIEQLFEINRTPLKLQLKSNIEKGYVIDYEGEYAKYFEENGGGWDKLYEDHPNADGFTEVSRPVYDKQNRIVIICVGTQVHWLAGLGEIIIFKLEHHKLKELFRIELWIS